MTMGDNTNKKGFPHRFTIPGQEPLIRYLPFSAETYGHVGIGFDGQKKQARYYFWVNQTIRSLYHRLRDGLCSYRFSVHQPGQEDGLPDYMAHTGIEYQRQDIDSGGEKKWLWVRPESKPDHQLDCDQMNLVAALMDPRLRQILYAFSEEVV